MPEHPTSAPSLAPENWGGWLRVLWFLGHLPGHQGLILISSLGPLMFLLMKRRRRIALRNLERCFPDQDEAWRQAILKGCFGSLARMICEAEEVGKGVLLVTSHMTSLEIGGSLICRHARVAGLYRPLNNPVAEWYKTRGRLRYSEAMISKRDPLAAVRYLKKGGVLWYAPDQDFGASQSVFAPFFGIQTATLLATHRLPKITDCAVVPMFPRFDPEAKHYHVYLLPAFTDFPSDDPMADLTRVNALMEEQARQAPEQYWWIHRRFKTRPVGEEPFYSEG